MGITTVTQLVHPRDYWMHRDTMYPMQFTPTIKQEGERMVELANQLLERAAAAGVSPTKSGTGFGYVDSGWRPPSVNAQTPRAAKNSLHMTGRAIDLSDDDGELDDWCMSEEGQAALIEIGLWMEHPSATKGWCHLQSVPPKSGKRVYYP